MSTQLLNDLISNFNVENLKLFFRIKLPSFRPDSQDYEYLFSDKSEVIENFRDIFKLGEADISDSNDLIVITAKSISPLTNRSGKKRQYEIAKKIMKSELKDSAFFIFYDEIGNFRFSFIRTNYTVTRKEYTDFKRFTYFVSTQLTNKTFKKQITEAAFNNLDSIQDAFKVEPLTKEFYTKLQHWYFWAIHNVTFPSESEYVDKKQEEYRAQNVIRLLTRLLFVWFIKQKGLIPNELFNLEKLQADILKKITPLHGQGLITEENKESIYYKAVLQNLFFATLNCPICSDDSDKRERGFRGDESYGKHRGVDYMMRYKKYFQDPDAFLDMLNEIVPFLNGGLFECLDDKDSNIFIDGFSDNLPKVHSLVIPDYLFFGKDETIDLSADFEVNTRETREVKVGGLINLLESYNFTIDENEPDDIEVALDPELLGKVFENLLASYNPETRTTARKQTGSFYTPREIVNYMVDESLVEYLKSSVNWESKEDKLDDELRLLISYDEVNPFEKEDKILKGIINSLDKCKILDPACGSGAFPMGMLQKMVHILRKVDPENKYWQDLQLEKAINDTKSAFYIKDKEERLYYLNEINEAFDETINDPDYARKLFIIENCIYGVDIQPIASQISKLRFFISLVVEQKVDNKKKENNFGVRPLPNLETKFVTANSLIGLENTDLYKIDEVIVKEDELKKVRHKLFSAKDKKTKKKYREKDKELRIEIASILEDKGFPESTAKMLSDWDPYDQNASSPFFDPEWMFDIKKGFDIIIGNPPYVSSKELTYKPVLQQVFSTATGQFDLYSIFIEKSYKLSKKLGVVVLIIPDSIIGRSNFFGIRNFMLKNSKIKKIIHFSGVFESAAVDSVVFSATLDTNNNTNLCVMQESENIDKWKKGEYSLIKRKQEDFETIPKKRFLFRPNKLVDISRNLFKHSDTESQISALWRGEEIGKNSRLITSGDKKGNPIIFGESISKYRIQETTNTINNNKIRKDIRLYKMNKVVIRQLGESLNAAYDRNGYITIQSVYNIVGDENIIKLFNVVYNSKLFNFLYYVMYKDKQGFPRILIENIKELPLAHTKSIVFNIFNDILTCKPTKNVFIDIADALVFELYFEDHMKERRIDVREIIEKDIDYIIKNNDFENMSDGDKERTIASLEKKWTSESSEVMRRISSFAEKSPDILKPIIES